MDFLTKNINPNTKTSAIINNESADTAFVLIKWFKPLAAVYFATSGWDQVTKEIFENCFHKAEFKHVNVLYLKENWYVEHPDSGLEN